MFFIFMEEDREIRVKTTSDENKQENNSSKPELISFLQYRIIFTSLWFNKAYILLYYFNGCFFCFVLYEGLFPKSLPAPHIHSKETCWSQ